MKQSECIKTIKYCRCKVSAAAKKKERKKKADTILSRFIKFYLPLIGLKNRLGTILFLPHYESHSVEFHCLFYRTCTKTTQDNFLSSVDSQFRLFLF